MLLFKARSSLATAACLVLLVASCTSVDAPTSPTAPPALALSAEQLERKAQHELLKEQLRALREQFKAEREARREEFQAAREEWKLLKKEYRAFRKSGGVFSTELLSCEPREFAGDAEIIGPAGGEIRIGPHRLTIPKGALDREVLISAQAPVSSHVEVELQPHGLTFARPAELELDYSSCLQPPPWVGVFIVYLGAQDQVLEVEVSRDKKGIKTVAGDLDHFSRYAVAW